MSEATILIKIKEAKTFLKQKMHLQAKTAFLDAAEIALLLSKTTGGSKYRKIAGEMIALAKEAKSREELEMLQSEVESVEEGLEQENQSSSHGSKKSSNANHLTESTIFEFDYDLSKKEEIDIALGFNKRKDHFWKPGELMNGILMSTGGSGSGKTELLKSLIIELTEKGYPVLVLDLHGDLRTQIPTVDIDYQGKYGINPLELLSMKLSDGGPLPNIYRLLNLFEDAIEDNFSSIQLNYLRNLLTMCYESVGIVQSDPESWSKIPPNFNYLRDILIKPKEILAPVEYLELVQEILSSNPSTVAAVKNRLLPILEHPAFNAEYSLSINSLFTKPLHINLKSLQSVDLQFVVTDTILNHLFTKAQSMGHVESDNPVDKFRMFIVIDEIKILSGNSRDKNNTYHILNRLATEARKYGLGLILASQIIKHYGKEIRANAATKIVLRPMDIDEAKANAKELQLDHKLLTDLKLAGECFYKTSSSQEPIRIRLYPSSNRPIESFTERQ